MRRCISFVNKLLLLTPALLLAFSHSGYGADNKVSDTRATLAKWVETRQMISRLKADWAEDRETIKSTISLFDGQKERLEEKLAKVGEDNAQVVKETAENETELAKYTNALAKVETMIVVFEEKLKAQIKNYPPPLRNDKHLSELLKLVPKDSHDTKVALISRVQNLILILKVVQEFNSELHLESEIRKNGDKDVEVQSLYLGLGQAWFVDTSGSFAGTGGPSPDGWAWTENSAIAEQVRKAIAVYDKSQPAAYVALPAEVK